MPLLDWLEEDKPFHEQNGSFPGTFLVPVVKRQWGVMRVTALDEEGAHEEFANALTTRVEADTEWDDYIEYDYDSCGGIERE